MILTCFAVSQEAAFFSAGGAIAGVEILLTGIGERNAAKAIESALDAERPDVVLTCGFAGGLRPGLPVGAVVYDADDALKKALSKVAAVPASFHSSSRVASTAVEKRALRDQTGADAVEMESRIIRRICAQRGIPSATVRVISDSVEQDLPLDFNTLMTSGCEIDYRKVAWALARCPTRLPALLNFQRQTKLAARNLGSTLRSLVRQQGILAG